MPINSHTPLAEIKTALEQARRDAQTAHDRLWNGAPTVRTRKQLLADTADASERASALLLEVLNRGRCEFCFKHYSAPHSVETLAVHKRLTPFGDVPCSAPDPDLG